MRPLAGDGDVVTQSLVKTILLAIGCAPALSRNVLGPILLYQHDRLCVGHKLQRLFLGL